MPGWEGEETRSWFACSRRPSAGSRGELGFKRAKSSTAIEFIAGVRYFVTKACLHVCESGLLSGFGVGRRCI